MRFFARRPADHLSDLLERAPAPVFVAYAVVVSFSTYFCMYAYRKPFAAATFEGVTFVGSFLELKSALVISQIIGYATSKYIGIKICSEIDDRTRARLLVLLIGASLLALVLYGLVPDDWKVLAMFLNGLPLGMVWGLVVRYLEGRRSSELLLAGLSSSFIVSSGVVKDVGRAMMSGLAAEKWSSLPLFGDRIASALGSVSEAWMPALTGAHFLPLFLLSVWLLDRLPAPSAADIEARRLRESMDGSLRSEFVGRFLPGLVLLGIAYFFLTAYRDFRDNYAVEIFGDLGYTYAANATLITRAETWVALGVIIVLALLNLIRENRAGLLGAFAVMTGGVLLLAVSNVLFQIGVIDGFWWMTLVGFGSYMAYVPYGSVLFDRLIASTGAAGTAVFGIYLADAIGYTGSVAMMIYKDWASPNVSRLIFFQNLTWLMALVGVLCLGFSCAYFLRRSRPA